MVDFVFYLGSAFRTLRIQKKMYVGLAPPLIFVGGFAPKPPNRGSTPQSTDAFRLNRPSQLVLGVYPWLAFLNQVHRPSSLRMLNTKSTISQKLNIAQKKFINLKISFKKYLVILDQKKKTALFEEGGGSAYR